METVFGVSVVGILLVGWWLLCNVSQRYWKQRELLIPIPQQGEADTADNTSADTIADDTNADTFHDIWSCWTCPGLVESLLLTPGQPSRTGPGSGSRASSAAGSDCRTRRCI